MTTLTFRFTYVKKSHSNNVDWNITAMKELEKVRKFIAISIIMKMMCTAQGSYGYYGYSKFSVYSLPNISQVWYNEWEDKSMNHD